MSSGVEEDDGEIVVRAPSPPPPSFRRRLLVQLASLTPRHAIVFLITFISYSLYHASRKTLSTVKGTVKAEWTRTNGTIFPGEIWQGKEHVLFESPKLAEDFLGALDALFMFAYAIGLYISGWVGDRLDPRFVLTFGMIGSSITLFLFGTLSEWLCVYSIPYYVVLWLGFGALQACGWPSEVSIMANWFGSNRGLVLGLWAACQSVGNIVGAAIVSFVLPYGYEYAFLTTSSLMFFGAFVVFFGLVSSPKDLQVYEPLDDSKIEDESITNAVSENPDISLEPRPPPISFWKAILLPGVLAYCLCNACLKLTNYAFFFWLPYYLDNRFHWPESMADQMSIWYDVGAVFGSVIGGVLSDWLGYRSPVVVVMLAFSLLSLYGYSISPSVDWANSLVMSLVGCFVGGPYNVIAATVAADLGSQSALSGDAEALSTVTGLIDGTGSVGSAIGQILVPIIEQTNKTQGWTYVFYLFIIMNFLAILCLLPRFWKDLRSLFPRLCGPALVEVSLRPQDDIF